MDPQDFPQLEKIHTDSGLDFELTKPNYDFGTVVVERDSRIIGAGFLRPILEAVMILDKGASLREKSLALRRMIHQAMLDTKSVELNEVHAWVKEPNFKEELIKHYGFEKPRGESLVLRI